MKTPISQDTQSNERLVCNGDSTSNTTETGITAEGEFNMVICIPSVSGLSKDHVIFFLKWA